MENLQYIIPAVATLAVAAMSYLVGKGKNKADADKSNSETTKNVSGLYKEAVEYWHTLYEKERHEKEMLIEKQNDDRKKAEGYMRKIEELERKIDILTSQVREFTIKYQTQEVA
jgi:hypothetical protein